MCIDMTRSRVAVAAVAAGAVLANDVGGGPADRRMAHIVAEAEIRWMMMHWRGAASHAMHAAAKRLPRGGGAAHTCRSRDGGLSRPGPMALDPGLGFAKLADHDIALPAGVAPACHDRTSGVCWCIRKLFLSAILAEAGSSDALRVVVPARRPCRLSGVDAPDDAGPWAAAIAAHYSCILSSNVASVRI